MRIFIAFYFIIFCGMDNGRILICHLMTSFVAFFWLKKLFWATFRVIVDGWKSFEDSLEKLAS